MNPLNKILVPVDFTEVSQAGLAAAKDIMNRTKSKLLLFNVVERPYRSSFRIDADISAHFKGLQEMDRYVIELVEKRKRQFDHLITEYGLSEDQVETMVFVGQFKDALELIIKETSDISLVVMGTSGETSIAEYFTGNHFTQTSRALDIPVWAVKGYEPISRIDKFLLLVD